MKPYLLAVSPHGRRVLAMAYHLGFEQLMEKLIHPGPPDPVELRNGEEQFQRFATVLDDYLPGRDWLVGKRTTPADLAVGSMLEQSGTAHYPVESYRHLRPWYGIIAMLQAWQKSVPANFINQA